VGRFQAQPIAPATWSLPMTQPPDSEAGRRAPLAELDRLESEARLILATGRDPRQVAACTGIIARCQERRRQWLGLDTEPSSG
jgi:hypothetical protein